MTVTNSIARVSFDRPAIYVDFRVTEYSGLSQADSFDVGTSASGEGTFADSGSVTTSPANEILIGARFCGNLFRSWARSRAA